MAVPVRNAAEEGGGGQEDVYTVHISLQLQGVTMPPGCVASLLHGVIWDRTIYRFTASEQRSEEEEGEE